jgi:hypothetical protein
MAMEKGFGNSIGHSGGSGPINTHSQAINRDGGGYGQWQTATTIWCESADAENADRVRAEPEQEIATALALRAALGERRSKAVRRRYEKSCARFLQRLPMAGPYPKQVALDITWVEVVPVGVQGAVYFRPAFPSVGSPNKFWYDSGGVNPPDPNCAFNSSTTWGFGSRGAEAFTTCNPCGLVIG